VTGTIVAWVAVVLVVAGAVAGLAYLWQSRLQLCPHCGWIVRQVRKGWLRCTRCHKQYGKHHTRRLH
jgi:tRNA(Ile2) C34 agmatinyltransferase TiaS